MLVFVGLTEYFVAPHPVNPTDLPWSGKYGVL